MSELAPSSLAIDAVRALHGIDPTWPRRAAARPRPRGAGRRASPAALRAAARTTARGLRPHPARPRRPAARRRRARQSGAARRSRRPPPRAAHPRAQLHRSPRRLPRTHRPQRTAPQRRALAMPSASPAPGPAGRPDRRRSRPHRTRPGRAAAIPAWCPARPQGPVRPARLPANRRLRRLARPSRHHHRDRHRPPAQGRQLYLRRSAHRRLRPEPHRPQRRLWRRHQPLASQPHPGRLLLRRRHRRRLRLHRRRARHRHRRLHPPSRRLLRRHWPQAHPRPCQPRRRGAALRQPRLRRPARPHRARLRHHPRHHRRPRPVRPHYRQPPRRRPRSEPHRPGPRSAQSASQKVA